jgi:hypothetical protein
VKKLALFILLASAQNAAAQMQQPPAQYEQPKAVQISGDFESLCTLFDNGEVVCLGRISNNYAQRTSNVAMPDGLPAKKIAVSRDHGCAILSDDSLACWGSNENGQLGRSSTNTRNNYAQPVARVTMPENKKVIEVAVSINSTCAIVEDGRAVCWGQSTFYLYSTVNRSANSGLPAPGSANVNGPMRYMTFPNNLIAKQITVSSAHGCAILSDDQIYCWGYNRSGMLGLDVAEQPELAVPSEPALPGRGLKALKVVAGEGATCGVFLTKTDSEGRPSATGLKCWGNEVLGRLGLAGASFRGTKSELEKLEFVQMPAGTIVRDVAIGASTTCVVTAYSGLLLCWGQNNYKQAAMSGGPNGRTIGEKPDEMGDALQFFNLGTLARVRGAIAGDGYTCGVLTSGSVKCWGRVNSVVPNSKNSFSNRTEESSFGDNLEAINFSSMFPNR